MALLPVAFNAQDGKVGINTEKPTRTLDIKGDLRVRTIEDVQDDFNGLLVPTDIYVFDPVTKQKKISEKNVVKMANFKGNSSFNVNMESDLIGGDVDELGQPGKITDNRWIDVKFKTTPPPKDANLAYAEVSSGYPTAIKITKSGFYQINVITIAEIEGNDTNEDPSSINYAVLDANLSANLKNGTSYSPITLGSASTIAFKGAKIGKTGSDSSQNYIYSSSGQKQYKLNIATAGFFPKDSYIYLQLRTFGMPGVVDTYSNFKFKSTLTSIQITKNL